MEKGGLEYEMQSSTR